MAEIHFKVKYGRNPRVVYERTRRQFGAAFGAPVEPNAPRGIGESDRSDLI